MTASLSLLRWRVTDTLSNLCMSSKSDHWSPPKTRPKTCACPREAIYIFQKRQPLSCCLYFRRYDVHSAQASFSLCLLNETWLCLLNETWRSFSTGISQFVLTQLGMTLLQQSHSWICTCTCVDMTLLQQRPNLNLCLKMTWLQQRHLSACACTYRINQIMRCEYDWFKNDLRLERGCLDSALGLKGSTDIERDTHIISKKLP